jgi:hypothetical protein
VSRVVESEMQANGGQISALLLILRNGGSLSNGDLSTLKKALTWVVDFNKAEGMVPLCSHYRSYINTIESMQDARKRK